MEKLPSEVCESFVCFCHFVNVFFFLEGTTGAVDSIHDFACKTFFHSSFASGSGIVGEPAETESLTSFRTNFERYLIVSTTYTAGFTFKNGHDVFESFLESFKTVFTGFCFYDFKCFVDNFLGNTFLPSSMILLTRRVTMMELYIGSGKTSRFAIFPLLGTFLPSFIN